MSSIVRVSILTIPEGRIDEAAEAMRQVEEELKGILKLKGLRAYFAGVDPRWVAANECQCVEFARNRGANVELPTDAQAHLSRSAPMIVMSHTEQVLPRP